ncbi:hypothetical protein [Allokutzneria albata]|uniref:Uncharacterized protein n=1 Tax=Allokutzneria albata TaxID=211114 RepID=A0A1G9RHB3_ALLAB|nr:hypothetical protein [Allokutzneria albata]SDM22624.1 hypothetical protein SAMN04489726_0467 [Allokutzneria albata]
MNEADPHIHVERKVLESSPAVRNLVTSMLGRAIDAPSVVASGCGLRVPYAMTSPHPESVTCLPCRDHAHREYLRFADQFERLGAAAGSTVTSGQVTEAAQRLRDLANRFARAR